MRNFNSISTILFSSLLIAIAGCTKAESSKSPKSAKMEIKRTTVMDKLESPWDLAFHTDGSMYFTEKCNGLSVRDSKGKVQKIFGVKGYATEAEDLFCESQTGMHGVALDPDFKNNRILYVYMSSNLSKPKTNRVVKLTLSSDLKSVQKREDIVTDIPFKNKNNSWGSSGAHSGGRIRFSSDGFLFVTTGDNHNSDLPQNLNKLGGKVLRIKANGTAAPGNNPPKGADPRIFTYGHRNVQGITFDPITGQPFISEHGPKHSDEVTALTAGGNGGWDPRPKAGVECDDNYCGYISNRKDGKLTSMTDLEKFPQAMKPVHVNKDSAGMGPALFLKGDQWQSWNGSLLVSIMGDQRLDKITLDKNNEVTSVDKIDLPKSRMRSLVQSPDGDLYIATDEGEIWRVTP